MATALIRGILKHIQPPHLHLRRYPVIVCDEPHIERTADQVAEENAEMA
jgi:hypothetical protein